MQQAAGDLLLGKVRTRHHDIVAVLARHQLGVQDLVGVVVVVVDLDAGLFLEVLQRVFGDVVRPVVDVQQLGLVNRGGVAQRACAKRQREGCLREVRDHLAGLLEGVGGTNANDKCSVDDESVTATPPAGT